MAKVTVRWEVEDGYVGKTRPQSFEMDLEDFNSGIEGEIIDQLHEAVEDEFRCNVSWYCNNEDEVVRVVQRFKKNRP